MSWQFVKQVRGGDVVIGDIVGEVGCCVGLGLGLGEGLEGRILGFMRGIVDVVLVYTSGRAVHEHMRVSDGGDMGGTVRGTSEHAVVLMSESSVSRLVTLLILRLIT